jgi:hypothetical protein
MKNDNSIPSVSILQAYGLSGDLSLSAAAKAKAPKLAIRF